jgi:purine-cytosine permease-like protein
MKLGTNVAVFILFFGIALIEALQRKNWLLAFIFFLVGLMSLWADGKKKK